MSRIVMAIGFAVRMVPRRFVLGIYGIAPMARMLRTFLNVLVPTGMQEVKISAGPLAGARLVFDLSCEKYLWLGTYEPWVQEAILRYCLPGAWMWDVGAFIGYHTLLMRRVAGPGHVIAIEPDPVNRSRLEQNLALNGAQDVAVLPVAIGERPGVVGLKRIASHPGQTKITADLSGGVVEVVTLDRLLEHRPPPGVVKMDVEGAEAAILAGAPRLLREVRPVWIVELHGEEGAWAAKCLREAGYSLSAIGKGVDVNADLPVGGPAHVVAVP